MSRTALAYVWFATEHPALLELMYARKHREPVFEVRAASDACATPLLALLADGDAAIGDAERFGVILLASLQGVAALAAAESLPPAHDPDELVADAVQRLLRGSRASWRRAGGRHGAVYGGNRSRWAPGPVTEPRIVRARVRYCQTRM
ncbi:TetR-like C-terminal domain-containing protein [Streptomyces sp. NPDC005373]|uniref:TetR-like C-terminal domain-containing protein n=1 Tax=Streptomyces sp. NPDC005373 TaxID=3156879 RepID=UPI0033BB567F